MRGHQASGIGSGVRHQAPGIGHQATGGRTILRWPGAFGQSPEACSIGFSLIELLVAMTLLAVGLLGIARLTTIAISGNLSSQRFSTASVLGQELMEDARRSGPAGLPEARTEDYQTIPGYPAFKRVVGVAENEPAPGLKTFSVTVYWDADARSIRLQTILAP